MIDLRSTDEVRAAEATALAALPDGALMQRAATGLAVACLRVLEAAGGAARGSRVVVLAGSGHNGGDALWAGSRLAARGCRVDALALADRLHEPAAGALLRAGGRVHRWSEADGELARLVGDADLVIDGIIGIGGSGGLRPDAARLAEIVAESGAIVVAVDVPSGVSADTGSVAGAAVTADVTVTFGAVKPGLVLAPGSRHSGTVLLVDIGLVFAGSPAARSIESIDVATWVSEPAADAYKYRRGVVGVSAGSAAYQGAALLAMSAARRGNVGMARFLDRADGVAGLVVSHYPDIVVDGSEPDTQRRVDTWVCGPGFVGDDVDALTVRAVLAARTPVVLDAGALTVVAQSHDVRTLIAERGGSGLPTVVTPHEGEFDRLFPGLLAKADGRLDAARRAAAQTGAVVVLKGPGTVVAEPGGACFVDTEGSADLGTAGSGDVLSGLLGALLASAWADGRRSSDELTTATAAAVWLHGAAGRIAAERAPVVAPDIADAIGSAIRLARFGSIAGGRG